MHVQRPSIDLTGILSQIKSDSPDWQHGDNLTFLDVPDDLFKDLGRLVLEQRRRGVTQLSWDRQRVWGAALFLLGAQTFYRTPDGPFTYLRMWEMCGRYGYQPFDGPEYEAIAAGTWSLWGIKILRDANGNRKFQGTMLFHSGGGWLVLEGACQLVPRKWNWEALRVASLHFVADWLETQRQEGTLSKQHSRPLEHSEARYGTALRLQQLAEARARIVNCSWLKPSTQETLAAIQDGGASLRELFLAPDDQAAERLLPMLFDLDGSQCTRSAGTFILTWHISRSSLGQLMVEVPERIAPSGIPTEVESLSVQVAGAPMAQEVRFERECDHFRYDRGPRRLPLPDPVHFPVEVIGHFQQVGHSREVALQIIELPGEPVAMFIIESGRKVTTVSAGTRVGLACAPGFRFRSAPGFTGVALGSVDGQVGTVPNAPTEFTLETHDGPLPWVLAPATHQLDVDLIGRQVPGLTFSGFRAFSAWPTMWLEGNIRSGEYRLRGPQLDHTGTFRCRSGRVLFDLVDPAPGRYQLELRAKGRTGGCQFVLLPEKAVFSQCDSQQGTVVSAPGAVLRRLDGPESGSDRVELPDSVFGPVQFAVSLKEVPSVHLTEGRWRLFAAPPRAIVRSCPGGDACASSGDIGELRGQGGIEVRAAPGTEFVVEVRAASWTQRTDGTGIRFFPFSSLPPEYLRSSDRSLHIAVRIGDQLTASFGPFTNQSETRPHSHVRTGLDGRSWVKLRLPGPKKPFLHIEAVSASEPWRKRWTLPCIAAESGDGFWYDAQLPEPPDDYIVGLMKEDLRVSGMAFIPAKKSPVVSGIGNKSNGQHTRQNQTLIYRRRSVSSRHHFPASAPVQNRAPDPPGTTRAQTAVSKSEKARARDDAFERLRNGLEAEGEAFLHRIAAPMHRYGARWFLISEGLLEQATHFRLKIFLEDQEEDDQQRLLEVFDDAGVPWFAFRYEDFDYVSSLVFKRTGGTCFRWLRRLAELQSGLLIPAWNVWKDHPNLEGEWKRIALYLQPWQELTTTPPKMLDQDQLEHLTFYDGQPGKKNELLSPRLRGLLEARMRRSLSSEVQRIVDETQSRRGRLLEDLRTSGEVPAPQRGIPEQVRTLEEAVILAAYTVHHWRGGQVRPRAKTWEELRLIWLELPVLMDFWLNYWAHNAKEMKT